MRVHIPEPGIRKRPRQFTLGAVRGYFVDLLGPHGSNVIALEDYGLLGFQCARLNINDRHIVEHQQIIGGGLCAWMGSGRMNKSKKNAGVNGKTSAYFHRHEYYLFCRRSSPGSISKHVVLRAIPLIASRRYEGSSRLFAGTHARRSPMKKTIAICGAFLLAAIIAVAARKAGDTSKDPSTLRNWPG